VRRSKTAPSIVVRPEGWTRAKAARRLGEDGVVAPLVAA